MEGLLLSFNWAFDNGMNFVPQLMIALAAGLGFAVRANSGPWMIALVAGLGIAWGALAVSSFNHAGEGAAVTADSIVIRTLTFNVHDQNTNYQKAVDYILDSEADVVCLQEAVGEWRTAISTMLRLYPHALQSAKGGTILLSKYPVKVLDVDIMGATPYTIAVQLEGLERPVDLACLHLTRPESPTALALRNQQLGYLARTVFKSGHPVILMGDFNASTRSPALFRFMQQAGLRTAGPGFPPANSWPGNFAFAGIRIDHVMFSSPLALVRSQVGPNLGSNHRPVAADLVLLKEEAAASGEADENAR
jgi:endonuclease/exonuclease/phosphatase (EEP) superfamily protein YafD